MRNAKRLVLLTALCAIISCGGAGGGAGDKTSDNTPTPTNPNKPIDLKPVDNNPVPINPNKPIDLRPVNKRYTEIDFSKMNYDNTNYKFKEAENKDEIGKGEYGYNIYSSSYYYFKPDNTTSYKTKMIIKNGGIGLNVVPRTSGEFKFIDASMRSEIRKTINELKDKLKNLNEIEVNEGGTYVVFNSSVVNLSDTDIRSLLDRKIEK